MSTLEALKQAMAEGGEGADTKIADILKAFSEKERAGVDAKNGELLGKLHRYQPWELLASELELSPDDVRKRVERANELEKRADDKKKEKEAAAAGVSNAEVERMAQERASKIIKSKSEEWDAERTAYDKRLAGMQSDRDLLEDRYLRHAKKFQAHRVGGKMIDPLTADIYETRVAGILDPLPVVTAKGEELPWYMREEPDFRLVDDEGHPMPGKEGPMTLPEWFEDRKSDAAFSARFLIQKGQGGGASSVNAVPGKHYDPKAPARTDFADAFAT